MKAWAIGEAETHCNKSKQDTNLITERNNM